MFTTVRPAIALGALLALSGCISFGAEPPPSLLSLRSDATVAVGQTVSAVGGSTIALGTISAPQEISNTRVPVRTAGTSVAYVKDAVWVDQPTRQFARVLGETMQARVGRVVVDPLTVPVAPTTRLGGELVQFGIDADTNEAVATFDAELVRGENAIEKRRFEARVPVAVIDAPSVGPALNAAANRVAVEVADWVGR